MKSETMPSVWLEIRERIQSKWGKFTLLEIDSVKGNLEGLVGILQKSYGYSRNHAERECHDFQISLRSLLKRR